MADFVTNPRAVPAVIGGTGAAGLRGPEQLNQTRVIADVQDEIFLYMPSATPLTTLSGKLRKRRTVTQSKFDWLTKDEYPRTVVLAGQELIASTTLDVQAGQGTRIAPNYTLLNTRTRETVLVTSVSTDALTVVRGIGSAAAQMEAGDTLVFLRPVYEDGADLGTIKTITEDAEFNYTEILRTPFGFTGRQLNTDLYGGKDKVNETKFFGIEHAKSMEKMLFFGTRALRTGTHQQTFSGGFEFYVKSNVWNLNGTRPSERSFVEFLEEAMKWGRGGNLDGSSTKFLFSSSRWLTEIEFWAKDRIQYRPMDKIAGLTVGEYVTAHGRVMLVKTPILDYNHPDFALLVDLNHFRQVVHQGRDTKLLENRQGNGVDGLVLEYMSDVGAQIELEASHAILKGLPV